MLATHLQVSLPKQHYRHKNHEQFCNEQRRLDNAKMINTRE